MSEPQPRQIAVVRSADGYDGILAAFRKRADELKASRQLLGHIAGLTPGHMEKILANLKGLGRETWGATLGAHGMAIAFIEDPEAMKQIASRLVDRDESQVRSSAIAHTHLPRWLFNSRKARQAAKKRWANMTKAQRKRAGRKAVRARAKRRRERERGKHAKAT